MKTLYPFRVTVEWADTDFGPHEHTEQTVYAPSGAKALKLHTRLVGRIPADALASTVRLTSEDCPRCGREGLANVWPHDIGECVR